MQTALMQDLSDSWVEGRPDLRWRSTVGTSPDTGAEATGTSLLAVDPGCALPVHTDSAEEIVVVVGGTAGVTVGDEAATVCKGGVALIPKNVPHQVRPWATTRCVSDAVYAGTEVITTYEHEVQPAGERRRRTI